MGPLAARAVQLTVRPVRDPCGSAALYASRGSQLRFSPDATRRFSRSLLGRRRVRPRVPSLPPATRAAAAQSARVLLDLSGRGARGPLPRQSPSQISRRSCHRSAHRPASAGPEYCCPGTSRLGQRALCTKARRRWGRRRQTVRFAWFESHGLGKGPSLQRSLLGQRNVPNHQVQAGEQQAEGG